jgi:hypothetical protein
MAKITITADAKANVLTGTNPLDDYCIFGLGSNSTLTGNGRGDTLDSATGADTTSGGSQGRDHIQRTFAGLAMLALLAIGFAPVSSTAQSFASGTVETGVSGTTSSRTVMAGSIANRGLIGIESQERSDDPCFVRVLREDLRDESVDGSTSTNLCGSNGPTSSTLGVSYSDSHWGGDHVFVRAIRVCLNSNRDKVKGFEIKGSVVDANGTVMTLEAYDAANPPSPGGFTRLMVASAKRTNCDDTGGWQPWVECWAGYVASGLVAHFTTGNTPRELTGVALICSRVVP